MTVSELNQFLFTAEPQIIEFLCTAKVTEIQLDEGWCYIGCSTCSKKLIREETSFTCVPCNETNAVAKLKYRVILSVSDDTGAASFLGFDEEVASLTHVLASDAAHIVGIGTNAQVDIDLPRSLANLVGSTYTFQLRLKDFNFGPNHRSFTISRIFPARDLAPTPTFSEGGEDTDQSIPQSVATGSDVRAGIVNNGADQLTEADGARMAHEAVASGEDAGEATALSDERQPWLKEQFLPLTPPTLLGCRGDVDRIKETNVRLARQNRRSKRAEKRNKALQQEIQHNADPILAVQDNNINVVGSERDNRRIARALRMERLINKRVASTKKYDTGAAAFLGFDEEVASLTHVLASDAAQIVGIGTNGQVDIDLPRSLANLVGSTYTFQLRLKDFNFGPNHRTFTISRIFPARDLAPKPNFSEGGEVTDQAVPQSVAPGSDVRAGITNNVADQLTEADGARLAHEAVASGEDAGEATARKKARVE
ncbi:hypothetical protein F2Q68_00039852 [Brassica cretica]|uniref:Replication factor A C-terminal domain-containing protein n=1 Tax=Brassica cretica TaxID=69181 RepID=A0A8S9MGG6_BRACR|nr:hypothetical protein F2Q68_00039852 [Brassica cretica]